MFFVVVYFTKKLLNVVNRSANTFKDFFKFFNCCTYSYSNLFNTVCVGYTEKHVTLRVEGKTLDNPSALLADCEIKAGSTVQVIKVQGGGRGPSLI